MTIAGVTLSDGLMIAIVGGLVAIVIEQIKSRRAMRELREGQQAKAKTIDLIEHEVKPNGGSSMRDAVNRIEKTVGELVEAQDRADQLDRGHDARLAVLEDRTGPLPAVSRNRRFWSR
jgi:hypothetical protein